MRKLIYVLALVCLCLPFVLEAAGTVTTSGPTKVGPHTYTLNYSWTADAADGSVPATAGPEIEGYVFLVTTNPGSTAPTDNYDITLLDAEGIDVMGGELANRDTANSEQAVPKIGNAYGSRFVKGTLTLTLTSNSVNSATGTVKVFIYSDAPVPSF